jgi:hypothetical protein
MRLLGGRRGEHQGPVGVPGSRGPGFTLRTYTHLLPTSEDRTRRAIDKALGEDQVADDGGSR